MKAGEVFSLSLFHNDIFASGTIHEIFYELNKIIHYLIEE